MNKHEEVKLEHYLEWRECCPLKGTNEELRYTYRIYHPWISGEVFLKNRLTENAVAGLLEELHGRYLTDGNIIIGKARASVDDGKLFVDTFRNDLGKFVPGISVPPRYCSHFIEGGILVIDEIERANCIYLGDYAENYGEFKMIEGKNE